MSNQREILDQSRIYICDYQWENLKADLRKIYRTEEIKMHFYPNDQLLTFVKETILDVSTHDEKNRYFIMLASTCS